MKIYSIVAIGGTRTRKEPDPILEPVMDSIMSGHSLSAMYRQNLPIYLDQVRKLYRTKLGLLRWLHPRFSYT